MYEKIPRTEVTTADGLKFLFHDTKGIPRTSQEMNWAVGNKYIIPAFRDNDFDVPLLLKYVDVKLDWYVPSEEAFEVIAFIRLALGKEPENLNAKAHYFFIDCMLGAEEIRPYFLVRNIPMKDIFGKSTLILSTREFSKSVMVTYFIAYMAWKGKLKNFGRVNFGLYISDKMGPSGNVALTMATMESIITKSTFLSSQFQYTKFTQEGITLVRNPRTHKEINTFNKAMKAGKKILEVPDVGSRTFTLKGIGASGGRGSRDKDLQRPQFAIFDDMVANEKDAQSPVKLDAIESTIEGDVGKSLTPNNFKIFIGTAYAENDPIYKRVTDGSTLPIVFPRAEEPPHSAVLDRDGEIVTEEVTEEGFISVWEDRFPYELQRAAYRVAETSYSKGNPEPLRLLNQEFYCRITSERERLIPESKIKFENMELIPSTAKDYLWRITTDFTTTGGLHSDDSSAGLWAIDWMGTYRLFDVSCKKKELEEQYHDVYLMAKMAYEMSGRSVEIAVEIDGQQAVHLYGLKMYLDKVKFRHFHFAKEIDPQNNKGCREYDGIKSKNGGDKLDRLKLLLPTFMKEQLIFNIQTKHQPAMVIGINQIEQVTFTAIKSKHDDFLDMLSQNALIYTHLPSKPIEVKQSKPNRSVTIMEVMLGYNDETSLLEDDDYYNIRY